MASALHSFSVYSPFPSRRLLSPPPSRIPAAFTAGRAHAGSIFAVRNRDNLDDLQRANQSQKMKAARLPPNGQWDRFPAARTVQQMIDTMDRMLEDPLAYGSTWPQRERNGSYRKGRAPWDIVEREEDYRLRFDMPGMNSRDVRVYVEDQMLVVKAEKLPPKAEDGDGNSNPAGEWPPESFGKYSTRITLPENVEVERITAEVRDGVLYVTMPKTRKTAKILDINVQ